MKLLAYTVMFLFLAACPAMAQVTLRVCLDGGQEVPPVATSATGSAAVIADQVMDVITVTGAYANLSSPLTSVEIYLGDPFANSSVVVLTLTATGGTSGSFSGQAALTASQVQDVYWGRTYLNLKTTAQVDGEIRGQIAQRMTIDCPAELPSDPVLADISGDLSYGPKIGHATEAFNVSLDCSNSSAPGTYLIVVKAQKAFPAISPRGILWVQGRRFLSTTGFHSQDVVSFAPTDIVVPADLTLVGVQYMVQGYCGGRLSNGVLEVVGIGL